MAPEVAEQFHALVAEGRVRIVAGKVESVHAKSDAVRVTIVEKTGNQPIDLNAHWVINCTGPVPSNSVESNPAIGSLLVHGWLRPDQLSLGVETTSEGSAVEAAGLSVRDLFVVGTLRKPALWESTAVPELRLQAQSVADGIVELMARSRNEILRRS
jgi:uncharacterized NAD(P)/FAD-binding protein YdhS